MAACPVLLDDALRAVPLVRAETGPLVDVLGSGGGTPGIPLAASLPALEVTILEAERRSATSSRCGPASFRTCASCGGRAEEQPTDAYGIAVANAHARPPTAAELVPAARARGRRGDPLGVGPTAEVARVEAVAELLAGRV